MGRTRHTVASHIMSQTAHVLSEREPARFHLTEYTDGEGVKRAASRNDSLVIRTFPSVESVGTGMCAIGSNDFPIELEFRDAHTFEVYILQTNGQRKTSLGRIAPLLRI